MHAQQKRPLNHPLEDFRIPTKNVHEMKLYSVNTGYFKLDGDAMFGVVYRSGPLNPPQGDFRTPN